MERFGIEDDIYDGNIMRHYNPKTIARITLCGAVHIDILDNMNFTKPTEEQIKNLRDMLCIDVELFE